MTLRPPFFPIIYVRGYAATISEMEETVATPFMGFNLGSTKIRQDFENDIVRFIFESPLIRLMKDEGYVDAYAGGDFPPAGTRVQAKSVWVFRYYEKPDAPGGTAQRLPIEEFALDLRRFVLRVRDSVIGEDATPEEKRAFKVHLVAHSMGGLVCRTYLQNICRRGQNAALELPGAHHVDKVFTYATPHNGIEMKGLNVPDLGRLDRLHVRNFNRDHMREYLKISRDEVPVHDLDGALPPDRLFSFIGTNYKDYDAFFGLSKKGTGPMSDGLVMIKNAAARFTPRAYAHRSHSGHFGVVNSEEGYQNLRRFLFGDVRVDVWLEVDEITLPRALQKKRDEAEEKGKKLKIRANYNIDAVAKVRNAGYCISERRATQASAIRRGYDEMVKEAGRVYLFSGFLLGGRKAKAEGVKDSALAFAVHVGIEVPLFEVDNRWWFDEHFEGEKLLSETVTFEVRPRSDKTTVRYGLASEVGPGTATKPLDDLDEGSDVFDGVVPVGFPEGASRPPRPGFRGRLRLRARPWNSDADADAS